MSAIRFEVKTSIQMKSIYTTSQLLLLTLLACVTMAQPSVTPSYGYFERLPHRITQLPDTVDTAYLFGLIPLPPTREQWWRLEEDFRYHQDETHLFTAPAGTLTDGASIPSWAQRYVGKPEDYMNPAIIHDAYCQSVNARGTSYRAVHWRQVHRMFYAGCLADNVPCKTALVLYAAVRIGGPHLSRRPDGPPRVDDDYLAGIKRTSDSLARAIKKLVATGRKRVGKNFVRQRMLAIKRTMASERNTPAREGFKSEQRYVAQNAWADLLGKLKIDTTAIGQWQNIVFSSLAFKTQDAMPQKKRKQLRVLLDGIEGYISTGSPCLDPSLNSIAFSEFDAVLDESRALVYITKLLGGSIIDSSFWVTNRRKGRRP
jgi:hypothetical protein